MASNPSRDAHTISNYGEGPSRLAGAIADLSEADMDLSLSDDSWTIRMIVHHVADGDEIWKSFIRQALGNARGEFKLQWYWQMPQDAWAKRWDYAKRAIEPSLAVFHANRMQSVQLLEHDADALDRTLLIRWPNGGEQEVSVRWVVEMQTQHVEDHVGDIGKIREAHGC
jgi:uncharacterized damage-inducible protein DinB